MAGVIGGLQEKPLLLSSTGIRPKPKLGIPKIVVSVVHYVGDI